MFLIPFTMTGSTPAGASLTAVMDTVFGLDMPVWTMKVAIIGPTGGPVDVYLQTQDQDAGPWSDIAHLPQVAAAGNVAYRLVFSRGYNAPSTAQAVNTADGTPSLPVNTVLPWANGKNLRIVGVTGVGVTAAGTITVTGQASSS